MFYRLGAWQRVVMIGAAMGLVGYSWPIAVYAQEPADPMCETLFEQYIVRERKADDSGADLMAATQLIASRGRHTGYWRAVLAKLPEMEEYGELNCVRILGKMLEREAFAREYLRVNADDSRAWGSSAWAPSFYLEPEVVDELLRRAECAERRTLNLYVVALARSLDPRPQQFFEQVIASEAVAAYSARFHAAVGLGALGKSAGINWLIAHVEDTSGLVGPVKGAWPAGVPDHNLGTCCVYALRALSGQKNLESRAEWKEWWAGVDKPFLAERRLVPFDWFGCF